MKLIATLLCVAWVVALFALDRARRDRTSWALWLPIMWLAIIVSRPVSQWLGMANDGSAAQYMEGSPLDRNIFSAMVLLGLMVLAGRRRAVWRLVRDNAAIFVFLGFCAISIAWSDFPGVAFKRWIKFVGDHVMVMIVLTDPNRKWAVRKVFSRLAYLLLPVSVLFIKYYPDLGRAYGHFEGKQSYTGVTTDKNTLGMGCLFFGLAALWRLLEEIHERGFSLRRRSFLIPAATLATALWLLSMAGSMTSTSCFLFAGFVMAVTTFGKTGRRPGRVHLIVGGVVATAFSVLFLNLGTFLLTAVGRDPSLTGRTDIWASVLRLARNPWLGTGFESFWLGPRLEKIWSEYWFHPIEAHNGYLEIYLNLGWVGIGMLAVVMITGYRNAVRMLKWDAELAHLTLAFIVVGFTYNMTEAAVHTQCLVWIAFLLAAMKLSPPRIPRATAAPPTKRGRTREPAVSLEAARAY